MGSWTIGNIVIDTHREWIRFLEHHSDSFTKHVDIHALVIYIFSIQKNLAFDSASFHKIIHTVDASQQCGFTTAGWTDEGCDLLFFNIHLNILQGVEVAVIQIQIFDFQFVHTFPFVSLFATKLLKALIPITSTSNTTAVAYACGR